MNMYVHVDNSEFFRKQMGTFLSELGYIHESFAKGEDAMKAVKGGNVVCVITGLELGDMSGEDFIKQLGALDHPPQIVTVTSKEDEDLPKRLGALGVRATIRKSGEWRKELGAILA